MFLGEETPRPIPAARHLISVEELISLRFWPPARQNSRERMAIREGHHLSHIRGRGMEYDDVREYQPGDDIRHLDWRLMARTGEAHTKLYREERERPVFLLCDLRQSMQFATRGHFKSVLAAYAGAMALWTTLANGDRVGGMLLSEREQLFKPSNRRQQLMQMVTALSELSQPVSEYSNEEPALAESLARLEAMLSSGSIVYIFSDFHDVDAETELHLMRLAQRCELKLVLISDPLEQQLPSSGKAYRFSGHGRELLLSANQAQQLKYRGQFQQRLQLLQNLHNLRGVEFAHWHTDHHPLFQFDQAKGA